MKQIKKTHSAAISLWQGSLFSLQLLQSFFLVSQALVTLSLSLSLSNGSGEIKQKPVRLRGKARRASGALRGDGTVHGAICPRGEYGGRAKSTLNRVQERERIYKRRVEDRILNRAQRNKPFRVSLVIVTTHLRYL